MGTKVASLDLQTYIDPHIRAVATGIDTNRLEINFSNTFRRPGVCGTDPNMFRRPGRDPEDQEKISRPMQPHDQSRFMDIRYSMRFPDEEPRVLTRPKRDFRTGFIVPDLSTGLAGSSRDLHDRRSVIWGLTMIALRILDNQHHPVGLILPDSAGGVSVNRPGLNLIDNQRALGQPTPEKTAYEDCLGEVSYQYRRPEHKYLILISDFLRFDDDWRSLIKRVTDISRTRIQVWQVVCPWDMELVNLGRLNLEVDGQAQRLHTGRRRVRRNYNQTAQDNQADLEAFLADHQIAHAIYHTEQPFEPQARELFSPDQDLWN